MCPRLCRIIKNQTAIPRSNKYSEEFSIGINKINVFRAKITAITFFALDSMLLIASLLVRKEKFFELPGIYYGCMYILIIITMIFFTLLFIKLEQNVHINNLKITVIGTMFSAFILMWCGGISILDQYNSGQILVYVIATIAIAVTPILKPLLLILMYFSVQAWFIAMIIHFSNSNLIPFGNIVNSTAIVIISLVIACMRYKGREDDFIKRKELQEKSEELKQLNKELEETNYKLTRLSQIDGLTGIYNRLVFDRFINTEWEQCKRCQHQLSLLMIDVDYFKLYNDNYGHQAGDQCLRKIASVLSNCARQSSDIVSRYGGEEFAIILPDIEKEMAMDLAEKIRREVEEMKVIHEYSIVSDYVTISLGLCTVIPTEESSVEEFIGYADEALYEAKKENRNKVVSYGDVF